MIKRTVRSHYKIIGENQVPKEYFKTEKDALKMARYLNSRENTIHKVVAYKCIECDGWHIGCNKTILTAEDRIEAAKKLKMYPQLSWQSTTLFAKLEALCGNT